MARDSFPVAGNELTNYFLTLIMTKKGTGKNVFLEKWLAKEIKEKGSLCVLNPKEEIAQIRKGFTNYGTSRQNRLRSIDGVERGDK